MILPTLFADVIIGIETWIARSMDNVVSNYVRQWLDLPMSETFSTFALPNAQCGNIFILSYTKFSQCKQLVYRLQLRDYCLLDVDEFE